MIEQKNQIINLQDQLKDILEKNKEQKELLFKNCATVFCIFRKIEDKNQQLIVRCLNSFANFEGKLENMNKLNDQILFNKNNKQDQIKSLDLFQYQILNEEKDKYKDNDKDIDKDQEKVKNNFYNTQFLETLKKIFQEGVQINSYLKELQEQPDPKQLIEQDKQAIQNWKNLYYLINKPYNQNKDESVSTNLKLIQKIIAENTDLTDQTQKFKFLLSSSQGQLETILGGIVNSYRKDSQKIDNISELLNFIYDLSLLPANVYFKYDPQNFKFQIDILKKFSVIGLVNFDQQNSKFSTTKILQNFAFEKTSSKIDLDCQIIVETNFMVYVITEDREEQIRVKEIMKLFCKEPLSVFEPNMLVFELDKKNMIEAYRDKSISAKQIIEFFTKFVSNYRVQDLEQKKKNLLLRQQNVVQKSLNPLPFLKLYNKRDQELDLVPANIVQSLYLWEQESKQEQ